MCFVVIEGGGGDIPPASILAPIVAHFYLLRQTGGRLYSRGALITPTDLADRLSAD